MPGRQPLWAPWRLEYIEREKSGACIFCELPAERRDRERLILHRGRHVFVLLNRFPYSAGHLMVAPYQHLDRVDLLEPPVQAELMARVGEGARILEEVYRCEGLNVGANLGAAAGAGYAGHLHFHLVPRWTNDTNFMAAVAETRVIPKHLDRCFEELAPRFEALAAAG